ncbi:helix-turn-helix transcriptional regulator [Lysobacter sp. 22409]|uniref:helix-turn-helix transcriptional regulator n=1 Tax=Lysobacter sp. 22409 TaxID=3453917 RepID=UPI003F8613D8
MASESLLTRKQVEARIGFKHSTLYKWIAAGEFSRSRRDPLTGSVRWLESEIQAWIEAWITRSENGGRAVGGRANRLMSKGGGPCREPIHRTRITRSEPPDAV